MKRIAKSWLSWTRMETADLISMDWDSQIQTILWSLAIVAFGLLILAFDTRHVDQRRRSGAHVRDRIVGLEQRYFLVIFNGFLLYAALTMVSQKPGLKQEGVAHL